MIGCSRLDPISFAARVPYSAPSFHIPTRYSPYRAVGFLSLHLLGHHSRPAACRPCLADPPTVLPDLSCPLLHTAYQALVSVRPITLLVNLAKSEPGRPGGSPRWEIWGYHIGRRSHKLRQSAGRPVCVYVYAFLSRDDQHGEAQPRLRRCISGASDHQHSQYHPPTTVPDRVCPSTAESTVFERLGWPAFGQCPEVRQRVPGHHFKRSTARLRSEEISHERSRLVQAMVRGACPLSISLTDGPGSFLYS